MHMLVSIVDPSLSDDRKLKCSLFLRDVKMLPDVEVGDILRLHRLKVRVSTLLKVKPIVLKRPIGFQLDFLNKVFAYCESFYK